jgi:cyclase
MRRTNTPVKTTKLYDNVYLLQGAGGNMALQTGPEGNLLIDASFAPAVPRFARPSPPSAKTRPALINTHWHGDHTGGNEGLARGRLHHLRPQKTRERLSTPQTMKMFHTTTPAAPVPALCRRSPSTTPCTLAQRRLARPGPLRPGAHRHRHLHPLSQGRCAARGRHLVQRHLSVHRRRHGRHHRRHDPRRRERLWPWPAASTKIIPGHGPLGTKAADCRSIHDMLAACATRWRAQGGRRQRAEEAVAKKPTAEFDAAWARAS